MFCYLSSLTTGRTFNFQSSIMFSYTLYVQFVPSLVCAHKTCFHDNKLKDSPIPATPKTFMDIVARGSWMCLRLQPFSSCHVFNFYAFI